MVWQDAAGVTWLSYTEPKWLAIRHGLEAGAGAAASLSILAVELAEMAKSATESP
jgi:hypothetical protein